MEKSSDKKEQMEMTEDSSLQSEATTVQEKPAPRDQWGRQIEFALACVSYSVGFGNIWRFPYLCMRNGGGAFLIPYFISLIFCGIPLFFLEMCLGQFSGLGPLHIWAISPLFKGIGYSVMLLTTLFSNYYNMVTAWVLFYFIKSFTSSLPWSGCHNSWNTHLCYDDMHTVNVNNMSDASNASSYNNTPPSGHWRLPAEEYWKFSLLRISSGVTDIGDVRWELFGCFALGWLFIAICLCKGIKSLGKVVYVTALAPYLLLTVFLVRGLMLPGAMDGIRFYIIPDWGKLLSLKVWVEACMQIFYSLGPGWGGIMTMASYNKFNNNCVRDSIILPIINSATSFFAGFVVFTVVGFMAHSTGLRVEDISPGPGLVFIVYPQAILKMPISPLWAILFFAMLLLVGIDSQFGNVEVVLTTLQDSFPKLLRRRKILLTMVVCFAHIPAGMIFCTQAGMYYFQLLDWYIALLSITSIAVLECVIVMWIYGHNNFYSDIRLMLGYTPSIVWKVCWGAISPAALLIAEFYLLASLSAPYYGDYTYPPAARAVGWFVACITAVPIPLYMVYYLMQLKGSFYQRLRTAVSPSQDWIDIVHRARAKSTNKKTADECGTEMLKSDPDV